MTYWQWPTLNLIESLVVRTLTTHISIQVIEDVCSFTPCFHITSAFAFASNIKKEFCGNKWLYLHLTFAFSRTWWQRSKENANADVTCEPAFKCRCEWDVGWADWRAFLCSCIRCAPYEQVIHVSSFRNEWTRVAEPVQYVDDGKHNVGERRTSEDRHDAWSHACRLQEDPQHARRVRSAQTHQVIVSVQV